MAQSTGNFLERNFKLFVAVPVFATVFCIGALVGWRLIHPMPADTVVTVAPATAAPVVESPRKTNPALETPPAEHDISSLDVSRNGERPEKPPAPPEPEATPAAEPVAPTAPAPVLPAPPAARKADPVYEDPYVVPKNKPFIDSKTFQPAQPNDKPKPPQPAAKTETQKPQKPANKALANAQPKTIVLKNGRRIEAVSIAESNDAYVIENNFGTMETFAKSEVSMILKR